MCYRAGRRPDEEGFRGKRPARGLASGFLPCRLAPCRLAPHGDRLLRGRVHVRRVLSSVVSILNRTERPVAFHLLTMTVEGSGAWLPFSADRAAFLNGTVQKKSPGSSFVLHDLTGEFRRAFSESPNLETFYTPYSLLRLFLDVAFPRADKLEKSQRTTKEKNRSAVAIWSTGALSLRKR